jgi:poly-gamma-glutamate synthesis protein (capsule biosynthesis protein)
VSWLLAVALLLAGAGCGAGAGGQPAGRWRTPAGPATNPAGPADPPVVTLAFGGDVHFVDTDGGVPNRTGALLADPPSAFGPVSDLFAEADLAMVNLETAVTTGGTPEPKQFHFRAPPAAFEAVAAAGIDVVSLANNHALDFGRAGLADTLAHARAAGVPVVGAGPDATAAYAPWVVELAGVRVAVLALSQVRELWESWRAEDGRAGLAYALDEPRALDAVAAARADADVVVVYLHWGQEGDDCPTGEMTGLAEALAAAGADLVVGAHAHLLLGGGWLGDTYVQYGLGNFLWWRDHRFSNDTGVLWVTVRDGRVQSVELRPAVISERTGQPIPADGQDAERILRRYAELRGCTGLADHP